MLATAIHRGCAVAVACAVGAWGWNLKDTVESWRSKIPIPDRVEAWPANHLALNEQNVVVQQITMITVTSTAVEAYPKITAAPLLKRKLGSDKWDAIHEGIQAQKRDGETCPSGLKLCPPSLNGGCCPNDRECGLSSCLAVTTTSAAPVGCGGQSNLFACAIADGGGCCPLKHKCQIDGCSPLPGVVATETCGTNFYLCPASMNGGCCKSGMACGYQASCYSTAIRSFTVTQTITTTDQNSNTQTITKTITSATTPSIPPPPSTADSGIVAKVSASPGSVPKTSTSTNTTTPSTGLTSVQLGGIIGGAVGLLLAVIIATCLIIRRLNKAIKVSDANSCTKDSTSGPSKQKPTQSDIDVMSVDPLMMTPSEIQFPTTASAPFEADSSPVFRGPFSPRSPPHTTYQRGYNAVASSDASTTTGWNRSSSMDSIPQMSQGQQQPGSYFDIPKDPTPTRSPRHSRNWSNASDMSQGSNIIEMDAGADGDRRSSLQRALQGMNRMVNRHPRGDSPHSGVTTPGAVSPQPQQLTGGPSRADWQQPSGVPNAGPLGHTLGHIPEAGESRVGIDSPLGYPGPTHMGYGMREDRF